MRTTRRAADAHYDPAQIGKVTPPAQSDPNEPYLKDFDQRTFSELSKKYEGGRLGDFQTKELAAKVASRAWADPSFRRKMIASQRKVAHKPELAKYGLNREAVESGYGFMTYKIDAEANNSKFYEGVITLDGNGYRLLRRYGALTDSSATGKIMGRNWDHDSAFWYPTLEMAQKQLRADYKKRMDHGYVDAFGPHHATPDGKKLPQGQYPVGLTRQVGFGWGTQSVTNCIPALRELQESLSAARTEIQSTGQSAIIKDKLDDAVVILRTVAHADSTMAAKIMGALSKSLRRLNGSPRFLPDIDGRALMSELATIQRYISKQLSLCD